MNYSTQVLECISSVTRAQALEKPDAIAMELVREAIERGHKLLCPPPNKMLVTVDHKALTWCKMPFPEMVIEYSVVRTDEDLERLRSPTHKKPGYDLITKRLALVIDINSSMLGAEYPAIVLRKDGCVFEYSLEQLRLAPKQ